LAGEEEDAVEDRRREEIHVAKYLPPAGRTAEHSPQEQVGAARRPAAVIRK
jgi:hypothetical protein